MVSGGEIAPLSAPKERGGEKFACYGMKKKKKLKEPRAKVKKKKWQKKVWA